MCPAVFCTANLAIETMINEPKKIAAGDHTKPVISIIIATYNVANTLQICLDSIYAQIYPGIQILIIDGDSTDGTQAIIKANANRIFYWKSEPDGGIYYAMNKGLKKATGDYFYFLGADDELLPGFSLMADELVDPETLYYGSVLTRGLPPLGPVSDYYMAKTGIIQQSIIYPKIAFEKHSYNLKYRTSADNAFNMQCMADKQLKFAYRNHVLANFFHNGASGQSKDMVFEKDRSALVLKNFGFLIWLRLIFKKLKAKLK